MDFRRLLLVFLVIVVVLSCSFFLLNYDDSVHYNRVGLTNSSSIEMPVSDQVTNTEINGIHVINDTKNDLTVMYFNSGQGNQVAAVELEYIRNDFAEHSVQETLNNHTVWRNEENGTYMAFIGNHVTHDNILIICKDPEILEHMMASAQYAYFNELTNSTEIMHGENASAASGGNGTVLDSTGSNSNPSNASSGAVPEGYYWSGQDSDYIREYDDANGIHHIDRRNGPNEAYDPKNNKHYTNGIEDTEAYNKNFN